MSLKEFVDFLKKYAISIIALMVALIVLFYTLSFLHQRFGGNPVGQVAGKVGGLASGTAYNFQG
jgi:hypothetical protein